MQSDQWFFLDPVLRFVSKLGKQSWANMIRMFEFSYFWWPVGTCLPIRDNLHFFCSFFSIEKLSTVFTCKSNKKTFAAFSQSFVRCAKKWYPGSSTSFRLSAQCLPYLVADVLLHLLTWWFWPVFLVWGFFGKNALTETCLCGGQLAIQFVYQSKPSIWWVVKIVCDDLMISFLFIFSFKVGHVLNKLTKSFILTEPLQLQKPLFWCWINQNLPWTSVPFLFSFNNEIGCRILAKRNPKFKLTSGKTNKPTFLFRFGGVWPRLKTYFFPANKFNFKT